MHYVGSGSDSLTKGTDATGSTPAAEGQSAGGVGVGGQKGTQISKIEARGEVFITSDQDQTTKSDWALYDVPAQLVTVGGNVVLMQGQNVLKGDRLVIDLKTGESRFENRGNTEAGGRIRALFMPEDAKSGDGSKDEKPGKKSADKSGGAGPDQPAAQQPTPAPSPAPAPTPAPVPPPAPAPAAQAPVESPVQSEPLASRPLTSAPESVQSATPSADGAAPAPSQPLTKQQRQANDIDRLWCRSKQQIHQL